MDRPPEQFLDFARAQIDAISARADMLDVGGGAIMRIPGVDVRRTVLDPSAPAVERNDMIHEAIVGDAQKFDYADRRYDVIMFWNVLEHLARPEEAVRRALTTLRAGGIVILRGPTLNSTKALVTRFTPFKLHVAFYRHVSRIETAGLPGYAPFPTEHRRMAAVDMLSGQLSASGLERIYYQEYVGNQTTDLKRFSRIAYGLFETLGGALRLFSGNRYGRRQDEFVMAWRKPATQASDDGAARRAEREPAAPETARTNRAT